MAGAPWRAGLEDISCPVLIDWGEKDRILLIDWRSERFKNEIPRVDFRVLPKIGHVPMHDDPRLIGSMIRDFALAAENARSTKS